MDSEEFDWDTEGTDSSLGLDRLWALAEVASSLMQAATAVAALLLVKFMFSKKTTKIDEIFIVDLTLTT